MGTRSFLSKLIRSGDCKHYPQFIKDLDEVSAIRLFPESHSLVNSNVFVSGLALKECIRCGKVFIGEEKKRIDHLRRSIALLDGVEDGKRIVLDFSTMGEEVEADPAKSMGKPKLAEVATYQAVIPRYDLNDVILNPNTQYRLEQVKLQLEFKQLFYVQYNFQKVRPYGKATTGLFYGPSGTGKTRAAEGLAKNLGLFFLDVNLADLESRFISQTSKNIQAAFKSAIKENALIFFDEADTVLGKRLSSVTQGVDAEINMARSTMLKELEFFTGVCLFATNFESNIDKAFVRRISYKIPFEIPDVGTRERLWSYFLIDTLPLEVGKDSWVKELVAESEGFTGADIAMAIELSFPKSVIADSNAPIIRKEFLLESIKEVQEGKNKIGNDDEIERIKALYNLK